MKEKSVVIFRNEKYYCWRNTISNRYILCKKEEDLYIRGFVLRNEELQEIYTIDEWRDKKIKELGI